MSTIKRANIWDKIIANLFGNANLSDVILVVGEKRLPAHKIVLASQSNHFRSAFSTESTPEIKIDYGNPVAFEKLLQFAYTGELSLQSPLEEATEILQAATKFSFIGLQLSIIDYLKHEMTAQNFFAIYGAAAIVSIQALKDECFQFADKNAKNILVAGKGFDRLQAASACDLIGRPPFQSHQIDVYRVVCNWIQTNGRENSAPLLEKIRLSDLPIKFLLQVVRRGALFRSSVILDAVAVIQGVNVEANDAWDGVDQTQSANTTSSQPLEDLENTPDSQESHENGTSTIENGDPVEHVLVKMPSGKSIDIELDSESTINSVKEKLEARGGGRKGSLKIYREGHGYLNNSRTIKNCGIKNGETLTCHVSRHSTK